MKLIIMRHAEAAEGFPDRDRELTTEGRNDARKMGGLLAQTRWKISAVRHSPLVRTRQTASIIHEVVNGPAREESRLAPGLDPEAMLELFYEVDPNDCEVWVFHAPDVSRVSALLTGLAESAFYFTPGTMLAMNLPVPNPKARGMIIWKIQPGLLRTVTIPEQ